MPNTKKVVTVFECQEHTPDMISWLMSCGDEVEVTHPKTKTIELHTAARTYQAYATSGPLVVTCHNEQMAVMFKLKYAEQCLTATTIILTRKDL